MSDLRYSAPVGGLSEKEKLESSFTSERPEQSIDDQIASVPGAVILDARYFLYFLIALLGISYLNAPLNYETYESTSPSEPDFRYLSSHCAHIQSPSSLTYDSRFTSLASELSQSATLDGAIAYIAEPGPSTHYYANVSSLTWGLSERPLLFAFVFFSRTYTSNPQTIVLTPSFELPRARLSFGQIPASEGWEFLEWKEDDDPYKVLYRRLQSLMSRPSQPVVLDDQMRLFVADGLRDAGLLDVPSNKTKKIRERKTEREVEIMRCANEVTLLAVRAARNYMYVGMAEDEAKVLVEGALRDAGLGPGIFVSVQFGENAASPHYRSSSTILAQNDLVTLDVGGTLHGYWSDLTRTFALPESLIPPENLRLWNVVREAQEQAMRAIRPGAKCEDIDAAARKVIAIEGYGEQFGHRLGHGIGLEVHESPYIRGNSMAELESGNTFSNEPGIYIPGEVGIRLEDCVVVKEDGTGELLTARVGGMAKSPWVI